MCYKKRLYISFVWLFILILVGFASICYFTLPSKVILIQGDEFHCIIGGTGGSAKVVSDGELGDDGLIKSKEKGLLGAFNFTATSEGEFEEQYLLFGKIPIKRLEITVLPQISVIPCGNTIGVKIETKGVLIIGMSDIYTSEKKAVNPMRQAKVKVGDIITKINGVPIKDSNMIKEIVQSSSGNELKIELQRNDNAYSVAIKPEKNIADEEYRIGVWVRDSTAGIGTLTFYIPDSKKFGALGHGITDVDTNDMLHIGNGEILQSSVNTIKKGEPGKPGELRGTFADNSSIGQITKNSTCGIFGILKEGANLPNNQQLTIASRNSVEIGPAKILCNVSGTEIKSFDIEIQKISIYSLQNTKSMVIKITDPELINLTGGIVQGMSGSPIIQNGKIVGAVTHVFVNDPLRGYAIFIDNMIKTALENQN